MAFDPIIERILANEGGFVDDPADAGGVTNFGVTIPALSAYRGHACTRDDIEALTRDEAAALYAKRYIAGPGYGAILNPGLRAAVVDAGVLFGPDRVTRALQELVRTTADGVFGMATEMAVNSAEPRELANSLSLWRIRQHIRRCESDASQLKFLEGWFNRAAGFVK